MIDNPKLRKKYIEQQRLNKRINDLQVEHLKKYWMNL